MLSKRGVGAGPRYLLASREVPGVGGSSTASFDLFARMQRDGVDVHFLNLIVEDPAYLASVFGPNVGNPYGLANVTNCWLEPGEDHVQKGIGIAVSQISPDVVIAFGYPAAGLIKRNCPEARTVLMTGSCKQATAWVTTGRARDAMDLERRLAKMHRPPRELALAERHALSGCELIIAHSQSTRRFLTRFYPELTGRIYPKVISYCEWIAEAASAWVGAARPFDSRDIDVLFIANVWDRREKNYRLVEKIVASLGGRRAHVVGDVERSIPNAVHHGFIGERGALLSLMGRSRCVVCPSLIDAAPGILFEAAVMGCNVIASPNCGNADICHADLLAPACTRGALLDSIRLGIQRKYPDRLQRYLGWGSYRELLATLEAFAAPFESEGAA